MTTTNVQPNDPFFNPQASFNLGNFMEDNKKMVEMEDNEIMELMWPNLVEIKPTPVEKVSPSKPRLKKRRASDLLDNEELCPDLELPEDVCIDLTAEQEDELPKKKLKVLVVDD